MGVQDFIKNFDWEKMAKEFAQSNVQWHAKEWQEYTEQAERRGYLKGIEDAERVIVAKMQEWEGDPELAIAIVEQAISKLKEGA